MHRGRHCGLQERVDGMRASLKQIVRRLWLLFTLCAPLTLCACGQKSTADPGSPGKVILCIVLLLISGAGLYITFRTPPRRRRRRGKFERSREVGTDASRQKDDY